MLPFRDAESAVQGGAAAISLERLRAGDRSAFEAVFHLYYEPLYNFAFPYVRTRETAEELVQDVFCRLWERRATLPEPKGEGGIESVRAYLYGAVRNAALSWLRHERVAQRLYTQLPGDVAPPGMGAAPLRADAALQSEEVKAAVHHAVTALPEPYRQVLTLRSQHQLSYPEIAAVLEIPLKTVESRVTRAFKMLREGLERLRG